MVVHANNIFTSTVGDGNNLVIYTIDQCNLLQKQNFTFIAMWQLTLYSVRIYYTFHDVFSGQELVCLWTLSKTRKHTDCQALVKHL